MSRSHRTPLALAAVAAAAAFAAVPAQAAGSLKSAYVEEVIPAHTYTGHMTLLNAVNTMGPGTGILGIGSITLTNFDSSPQQVFIFVPMYSGAGCGGGGSTVIGGTTPQLIYYVQPYQTLHLPFPAPLVLNPYAGNTCIAAEVTTLLHGGSVTMDVVGVIN